MIRSKVCIAVIGLSLVACQTSNHSASPTHVAATQRTNLVSQELVQYVNPLMGTDSKFSLSNGNTYPAIATPWAMHFWSPMTAPMGDGWTYKYDDDTLRGIKQTHQPSPWLNDYGAFSLMAVTGALKFKEDERASWFSHKAETVSPDHYSVYLADYDVTMEVTPTERAAQFRFTFPETEQAYILLDAFNKGSMVRILPEQRKIVGYARNNHGGVPDNFHNYFVIEFDKEFELTHTWHDGWALQPNQLSSEGEHVGAIIGFKTQRGEQVHAKVASSFISPEQAEINLRREIGGQSFTETQTAARQSWQKELSRIRVEDQDLDEVKTFYSALYRVLLFPRKFYEYDANNQLVHYSPYNGEVLPGYMFTDNGFWDTFRAVFPFFTLMYPELDAQIMAGLANTYKESGWLPEWASPGHRNVMVGSNSAINIADAYLKGIRGFDIDTLYEAARKNAEVNEGRPMTSVGREGVDYYNKLGYVPYDVGIHENAARTLEYAFADFNLYKLAKALGKTEDAELFKQRAYNYRHLFDTETGWMRGKNQDGSFQSPFNPLKWGDAFTEGNALHYSWSVFHDIEGLKQLMGGQQGFIDKLDQVFDMPPLFDDSYYGFTIHEIREMQIVNMGNYAHGNQPIQHMIYLYNHAGQPWKAQQKVRDVMNRLYSATPDGYCGDEDNGQTSAWYVFSALGFYPVTPGTPEYVIGSPLFDKVTLTLEDGKTFVIESDNNLNANPYIQQALLNGKALNRSWLDHHEIQAGGTLNFDMGATPNKAWASDANAQPYSMSLETTRP
ncbi:GH92 family glycosyl hydrolase [Shewanella amazonensis]|uniref:Putative alpha-1,2-mannosidase n=1 Tax=Shewanella amazonensis (strain ATCC BAA-1098 / SB2B) TaxID=326297 RepID=A1S298_SHEAM|nr:GH92 family glycosyl hydrolase [Shewanella amazonensis]ABL98504.1 putative alpha-1,2-mannosidase [Shewanella amazonensis SB2B]